MASINILKSGLSTVMTCSISSSFIVNCLIAYSLTAESRKKSSRAEGFAHIAGEAADIGALAAGDVKVEEGKPLRNDALRVAVEVGLIA